MDQLATDVSRTLSYGHGKVRLKVLGVAALLVAGGMIPLFLEEWPTTQEKLIGAACIALGGLLLAIQLLALTRPREPLLRLSPEGLRLNLDGVAFLPIPWREVELVTAIDVEVERLYADRRRNSSLFDLFAGRSSRSRNTDVYKGVTAVLVSEAFRDKAIGPLKTAVMKRSASWRSFSNPAGGMVHNISGRSGMGPGWSSIFIPRDDKRWYVALHHSMLPVGRDRLRAEVEARWRAYGEAVPAPG